MSKGNWNFIIDVAMFAIMAAISGLGLLIKYVLLAGSERWEKYGRNVDLSFWGLDRHDWGKIHLILALALISLLFLHIILHWKLTVCLFQNLIKGKKTRIICTISLVVITISLVIFPFFIKVDVNDIDIGRERFQVYSNHANSDFLTNTKNKKHINSPVIHIVEKKLTDEHHSIDSTIEVKGFMTLQEVSNKYNISCELIKEKLNVPSSVNHNSKLGQLRKTYGFKMSEIETIIYNYKNSGNHEKDN